MTSPSLAPIPSEDLQIDSDPVVAPRARPVLSPPRTPPRVGRAVVGISVLIHLAVISAFVLFLRLGSPSVIREVPRPAQQIQYIDLDFPGSGAIVGIPAPAPAASPAPGSGSGTSTVMGRARGEESAPLVVPRLPPSGAPGVPAEPGGGGDAAGAGGRGAGEAGGGGGIGDRLRPGYRDTRLYVDQRVERLKETDTRSDIEKYRERLRSLIEASNDSAWAQGSHPNTDWTTRDKQGRKWGVDEKGVYLGGITIPRALVPTPRATGTNEKLEAERQKEKDRQSIRQQEEARERKKVQDEAIRETRARKEAEREKQADGGAN